jgi:hypothetical protein
MSFYEDASLVMIPSGYKSGKIYSQKPLSTDGQLTFTRASEATRVASNGLIEKVQTNLLLQSQTFQTTWAPLNSTVSIDVTAAPDGTLTADKLVENSVATAQHRLDQTSVSSAGSLTFSVSAKKSERDKIFLRIGLVGAYFNLDTGTSFAIDAGIIATISDAGNGWYRCAISKGAAASNEIVRINLADNTNSITYNGDGVSGAFIWGAQYELNDIATDYIPTTTAAVSVGPVSGLPRLDYLNSTCPKLLLEPQRTNLVTFSENFDNAAWLKDGTITANTTISPDGYQNADTWTPAVPAGVIYQTVAVTQNTDYIFSFYVKRGTINSLRYSIYNNTAGNFIVSAVSYYSQTSTTEWVRIVAPFTTPSGCTSIRIYTHRGESSQSTGTVFFWGAQLEAGAYATSYIPTLAASVTRVADAASKTGISSLIGQTEGTLFLDFESGANDSIDYAFTLNDGTTTNRIRISRGAGNTITAQIRVAAVTQALIQTATVTPNTRFKCALAYKLNDVALYVNGAEIGVDTSSTIPACSVLATNLGDGTGLFGRPINQALLFKTRLTNAQLAELTAL